MITAVEIRMIIEAGGETFQCFNLADGPDCFGVYELDEDVEAAWISDHKDLGDAWRAACDVAVRNGVPVTV